MKLVLLLAVLASGSARAAPTALETLPLVLAEVSLLTDALQTRDVGRQGRVDLNPIIGRPTDAKVALYFGSAGLATAAAWYFLPKRLRVMAPLFVLLLEVPQIGRNAQAGYSIRF